VVDEVDRIILSQLGKNARMSSQELQKILDSLGHSITDRGSYVVDAPFCTFSSRLTGDFDWICHFVFDSIEQYDLETNNFLNRFGELISDFRSYESSTIKSSPYMIYDEQEIKERKRIWFVDKQRKSLVLKFSAGKYTRIDGEFSKVSINSLKIGHIAKTNKPVVSNDVANDPRVKLHDWAKKEKLRSFAGYPLSYKGKSVAVVAMFSKKKLNHLDFELLGLFSDQLSKELAGFFEAKDFLSE
jgi:hypothetical protein